MYRIYTQTALTATLAAFGFAQAPQTSTPPTSARSTAQQASTASGDSKSYRGVLMDASCKAIQDRASSSISSDASSSNATARARAADSTAIGGAASTAPSGAGTSGSLSNTTNSGGTGASASTSAVTSATTGVATDQSGQATATKETTPPTEARSTASASGATLSGSSSNTNYSGTTGRAGTNTPTASASSTASTTGASTTDVGGTGDRTRASHTSPDSKWMTVREKYKDCKVTPTTTSFAIMSDGQIYMIDDAGGSVRQRMSSGSGTDFRTVTVMGTMNGDRLAITSIQ